MNTPLVSVVVVNWNGAEWLPECLSSLYGQTFAPAEILVVDNGSTDGSRDMLEHHARENRIRAFFLDENTGFAAGNNLAFQHVRGEWVALINNDAAAHPQWLERLVGRGDREKRVGMLGGKVLLYDRRDTIDKAGHLIYPDGLNRGRGSGETDVGQYDLHEETIWPDGCAALYHRDLLAETGGFDARFFAYGDDADLGMRARLLGWRGMYVPDAVVYHRHSSTAGEYSPLKALLVERNRILLALKNFPLRLLVQNPYWTLKRYFWQAYGAMGSKGAAGRFVELHGRWKLFATLLRAYGGACRRSIPALAARREIHRRKRLSASETVRLLRRFRIGVRELSLRD